MKTKAKGVVSSWHNAFFDEEKAVKSGFCRGRESCFDNPSVFCYAKSSSLCTREPGATRNETCLAYSEAASLSPGERWHTSDCVGEYDGKSTRASEFRLGACQCTHSPPVAYGATLLPEEGSQTPSVTEPQ